MKNFEFTLLDPTLKVHCGETVEYVAQLVNKTNDSFTLSHGVPLITLYAYNYGDAPNEGMGASLVENTIDANESIEKNISVRFTECGDYMLRAYCVFSLTVKNIIMISIR